MTVDYSFECPHCRRATVSDEPVRSEDMCSTCGWWDSLVMELRGELAKLRTEVDQWKATARKAQEYNGHLDDLLMAAGKKQDAAVAAERDECARFWLLASSKDDTIRAAVQSEIDRIEERAAKALTQCDCILASFQGEAPESPDDLYIQSAVHRHYVAPAVAAEKERCAKIAESNIRPLPAMQGQDFGVGMNAASQHIADAIRATPDPATAQAYRDAFEKTGTEGMRAAARVVAATPCLDLRETELQKRSREFFEEWGACGHVLATVDAQFCDGGQCTYCGLRRVLEAKS